MEGTSTHDRARVRVHTGKPNYTRCIKSDEKYNKRRRLDLGSMFVVRSRKGNVSEAGMLTGSFLANTSRPFGTMRSTKVLTL